MRIGLSTKITQPQIKVAAPAPVVAEEEERFTVTLDITDTWWGPYDKATRFEFSGATNSDGRYYNVNFPNAFVKWDAGTYGSDPDISNVLIDPFEDYREAGDPKRASLIYGYRGNGGLLPPINKSLDVIINIPAGTEIGSYVLESTFSSGVWPAIWIHPSNTDAGAHSGQYSSFTEEAAKNLTVTINNEGTFCGGGGVGGYGDIDGNDKNSNQAVGGGGGGGQGIHPAVGSAVGTVPGAPGDGWRASGGGDGAAGTASAAGAGGSGAFGNHGLTAIAAAQAGWQGGAAVALYNPLAYYNGSAYVGTWATSGTYASDWQSEGGFGPQVTVVNKAASGGNTPIIKAGGGGGGGGGTSTNNGGAGGDGGAYATIGSAGSIGTDFGAGGATNFAVSQNWPYGFRSIGALTRTNEGVSGTFAGLEGNV